MHGRYFRSKKTSTQQGVCSWLCVHARRYQCWSLLTSFLLWPGQSPSEYFAQCFWVEVGRSYLFNRKRKVNQPRNNLLILVTTAKITQKWQNGHALLSLLLCYQQIKTNFAKFIRPHISCSEWCLFLIILFQLLL